MTHLQIAMAELERLGPNSHVIQALAEAQIISDRLERRQPTLGTWGWYGKRQGVK